jgi:hypothetical protein
MAELKRKEEKSVHLPAVEVTRYSHWCMVRSDHSPSGCKQSHRGQYISSCMAITP